MKRVLRVVGLAFVPATVLLACSSLLGDLTVGAASPEGEAGLDGASPDGSSGGDSSGDANAPADGSTPPGSLLADAITVAAGRSHTCAINAAGDVLCWGANAAGQLGVPVTQRLRSSVPVKVDLGGSKAIAVAAGGAHTCAILADGRIKCWGANDRGQLGRGSLVATGAPDYVPAPTANATLWTTAEVITAGASFTCAGMKGGDFGGVPARHFFCWGENSERQVGTESTNGSPSLYPSLLTSAGDGKLSPDFFGFGIASGDNFACAGIYIGLPAGGFLNAAGCWGSRAVGQIGAPPLAGYEVSPEKWPLDSASKPVSGVFKVALLAAGAEHACVRFELPSVNPAALTCWGNNTRGQTGSSTAGPGLAARIAGFDATSVTALAAGGRNTCVLDASQVKCIGGNELGQLGTGAVDADPHNVFSSVKLPPSATSIAVGANHACAVLGTGPGGSGQVACWGHNLAGQLGDGLDLDVGYPASPGPAGYVRATPVRVLAPQ